VASPLPKPSCTSLQRHLHKQADALCAAVQSLNSSLGHPCFLFIAGRSVLSLKHEGHNFSINSAYMGEKMQYKVMLNALP